METLGKKKCGKIKWVNLLKDLCLGNQKPKHSENGIKWLL